MNTNEVNLSAYHTKMNEVLTDAFTTWWNNLTKEELLAWMAEQTSFTADDIRGLFENESCNLRVGAVFSLENGKAVANFGNSQ